MQALSKQPVREVFMPNPILLAERPCVKCGAINRYKSGDCKPCHAIRMAANYVSFKDDRITYYAAYRAANLEKIKTTQAAYRKANPEKFKAKDAAYRVKADPVKAKAYQANYYLENRASLLSSSAAYKLANPLLVAAYRQKHKARLKANLSVWRLANRGKMARAAAAWAKANPEARRINQNNRRAKAASAGVLSHGLAAKLFKLQKGRCACCGLALGSNYHLDHILPLALGGTNTDDNIQLLRQRCNGQKHSKHPVDFMQSRGFLL